MNAERFQRVQREFAAIAGLAPADRAGAIARLRAQEPALAAEVEELITLDAETGFLEAPAIGRPLEPFVPRDDAPPDELIGRTVGHYRVLSRIASGGMGTVYLAERADGQFDQRVAIKVVKRGLDTDEVLRRFHHERQTLAALNHPGIARLLDGGATSDGRPFLVMEFVAGVPIDEYCRGRSLDADARLALFEEVCGAVHYAHQNLVIHRDIKPQNVLVSAEGRPKLVDFGVAKVVGGAAQAGLTTEAGSRFTPEYASPEQVLGQAVTTATDVYSLGVLLYELLSGRSPYTFTTRTAAEIRRIVVDRVPPPPSATEGAPLPRFRTGPARRLTGDLDTIVLMAMRKEPARRYPSVQALRDDIERSRKGLPVAARPPTFRYIAGKFVRRNALGVGAAAAVLLVAGAGFAGTAWQGRIAARQRDLAVDARQESDEVTDFLDTTLAQADPGNAGPDLKVRDVLDAASDRARAELASRPAALARILGTIGRSYMNLGEYALAEPALTDSLALRRSIDARQPQDLVASLIDIGTLRYHQRRFGDAETALAEALAVAERRHGRRSMKTAEVLTSLGAVQRNLQRPDDALRSLSEALDIQRQVLGPDHEDVAETLNNLSHVSSDKGDLATAERQLREALAIREKALAPGHPMRIQASDNLAVILMRQNKVAEALPLLEPSLAAARERYTADNPILAIHIHNYASALLMLKRPADAEPLLREALSIRRSAFGAQDVRTIAETATLARALRDQSRFEDAETLLTTALAALGPGAEAAAVERCRGALAELYELWGKPDKAAEFRSKRAADPS